MQSNDDRLQDLFWALGDTTRRSILDLLAEHGTMTVTELASHFPNLVRSGISKHLMELRKLNVVFDVKSGRERHYQISPEAMNEILRPWVAKYEKYWDVRLQNLKKTAENTFTDKKKEDHSDQ